jgi:O-antigen ligase
MSPAPHDPFRLPVRVLAGCGLAALAALTLPEKSATRMFGTPWIWVLTGLTALPPVLLLWRLISRGREFRLPAPLWLGAVALLGLGPVVSALASPYQGPSLLAAGLPLAAGCLFLLLHDWLQADVSRKQAELERIFVWAMALVTLAGTWHWLVDLSSLDRERLFSATVFHMRNPHPLGHSNYTAGLMLLAFPWLGTKAWRHRGWRRWTMASLAALALLNLFTSGSRGGLLGLAALIVAAVAMARLGWKRFLLIAAGALMLSVLLAVANPRIRSMLMPGDGTGAPNESTVQRTAMLDAGIQMGLDRPVLGWGPGTTPLAYPRYRHALNGGAENVLQLHSSPLHLWAETGALGLLGLGLLGGLLIAGWKRSPLAAATLAGYGALALTDHQLDVPVFAAALTTLAALLAPSAIKPAGTASRFTTGFAVLAAVSAILLAGERDPTPVMNAEALRLAHDPARRAEAVTLFEKSLALNPDQEIAHFNLGWLLLVPEPAQAERHFLAAARLVPDKGGVYFGLALALLNQGNRVGAARALALECINEPLFLASPWWTVPEVGALREMTAQVFSEILSRPPHARASVGKWVETQIALLTTLAPRLGQVSPGSEVSYRRQRIGYPVLMRNADLPVPTDLYDVREDPRFPASVPFPLPRKGWLPSPLLLKLLDETSAARQ